MLAIVVKTHCVVLYIMVLFCDVPKDTRYIVKKITSCPDVGYFFKRDTGQNSLEPGPCYLCFCQTDGTAICWRRENRRCDVASYQHHGIGKRDARVRRSPGITDIFFRDASRDVFNKNAPESCKPYESSFSEGCPPADWCVGCTVCDCDANGRWDCHILSFCPDKQDKSKTVVHKKKPHPEDKKAKAPKKFLKSASKEANKPKYTPNKPTFHHKNGQNHALKKYKPVTKGKNNIQKNTNQSPKPFVTKKNLSPRKPVYKKSTPAERSLSTREASQITEAVVKHVMGVMARLFNQSQIINKQLDQNLDIMKKQEKKPIGFSKTNPKKQKPNYKNKSRLPAANKKKFVKHVPPKQKKRSTAVYKNGKTKKAGQRTRSPRHRRDVKYNASENVVVQTEKSFLGRNELVIDVAKAKDYYKYSIVSQAPDSNVTSNNSIGQNNNSNTRKPENYVKNSSNGVVQDFNVTVTPAMKLIEENMIIVDNVHYVDEKPKRTIVKIVKNNSTHKLPHFVPKSTQMATNITNETNVNKDFKSKSRLIGKIVTPKHKKYNTSKMIRTKKPIIEYMHKGNGETSFKNRVYHKIDDIQNILRKMLNDFRTNTTTKAKVKRRRFNLLRYLKRFFRKIFRKYKNMNTNNERSKITKHIINIICESFDQCDKRQIKNIKLESKIKKLNTEAVNILRSIRIIKGLLHLLDIPSTYKTDNEEYKFKNDIQKLNGVLRDHYLINNKNLSVEQINQIKYIKNNTQYFVRSVSNFANILNDIIGILTKKDPQSRISVDKLHLKESAESISNAVNKYTLKEDLAKLKNLLFKYNLVQNKFVRRMYDVLSNFEKGQEGLKVSDTEKEVNTSIAIEKFSRNIIKNLRKLKSLAETLNFSNRRKRQALRDDDAVEYLLTLMEYLLKQNYAPEVAPATDGIDLLIDAIRSAPDIKPIKKTVPQTAPSQLRVLETTERPYTEKTAKERELVSEPNSISMERNNSLDLHLREKEESDQDADDDVTVRNVYEDNTENVYYEKAEVTTIPNDLLSTTNLPVTTVSSIDDGNGSSLRKSGDSGGGDSGDRKFEVFTGDLEDSDEIDTQVLIASTTTTASYGETESDYSPTPTLIVNHQPTTTFKLPAVKRYNSEISKSEEGSKRFPFDWLDDGFDQDVQEPKISNKSTTVTIKPLTTVLYKTKKPALKKHVDTISSLTKELSEEEDESKSSKAKTEEIIFKKQMDLLNSLDYGTEKADAEESESKGEPEDAFPSYFV